MTKATRGSVLQPVEQGKASSERRRKRRWRLGLRFALTGLVISTVTVTALLIHLFWAYTAQQNVADVVTQLNTQIVGSIHDELHSVFDNAQSVEEAARSIFAQGAIAPTDEGKREYVFLALLRSQSSLSWISFGFPDGSFFGAQSANDAEINMVEVKCNQATGVGRLRIDNYVPEATDVIFQQRSFAATSYNALGQAWYQRALEDDDAPRWTMITDFPNGMRQAVGVSARVTVNQEFAGVANVVVELDRLSLFLASLHIGKTGTAVVLDHEGRIIASADPQAIDRQQHGEMPTLQQLGKDNKLLAVIDRTLATGDLQIAELSETRQMRIADPEDGPSYFVTFAPLGFENWVVATVIPPADFLASIDQNAKFTFAGLGAMTMFMVVIAILSANRLIIAPLLSISAQLKYIQSFRLDGLTRLSSPLREFDDLSWALVHMAKGLASFEKFMPAEVVRTLVSQGVEASPGGNHRSLTVLFTDIEGFTAMAEELGEGVVEVLTDYLDAASRAIRGCNGTIDKFIGDGVMAFWGAPIENDAHALQACAAALECQRLLAIQRCQAECDGRRRLKVRIGINTGTMLVGYIGSMDRLTYTVIGDPVNVASRIESLSKIYGTEIIIGEDTRAAAASGIIARRLDRVALYGRTAGIAIHELLGMAGDETEIPAWVSDYEAGLDAYEERMWVTAIEWFQAAIDRRGGNDQPSEIMIARCKRYIEAPPPDGWRGVTMLDSK